ncbi:ferredoxin-NADP reductase [Saccharomonospora amisosensis]|uniref:Ferredoxin-NADP reductase n=1 Tax=Saccharomonospora amisosensis TaxID=1128677 RepID=A0A7X5URG3_9PSEU|nr:FAD-binding oxidoreductase [Saccharomonospora amisosensis]NIJ12517.1 ferredoxin-NADP reductase [Saccharomonospora amisosensis]
MSPQLWWYLARAGGLVAWALLTLTVTWGLLLRTRLVPAVHPRALLEWHRFIAGLAVAFTAAHLTGILADSYITFGPSDVLVPFASQWRPLPVALGVLGLYLSLAVVGTSALMRLLPRGLWWLIHSSSYVLFAVATAHAVTAGTDAANLAMVAAVAVSVASVLFLTLLRILSPDPQPRAALARFHPLEVADVRRETHSAVSVAFRLPRELAGAYRFRPGQHVTLRARIGGTEVRRPYSICSGVADGELRVAVKHISGGLMSTWVNSDLRVGDVVEVMTPTGTFGASIAPRANRHLLGVAAGSGITPVLSIVSSVLALEPRSHCTLLYGNRTVADIMFGRQLARLERQYWPRLRVVHLLSRQPVKPPAIPGRLTAGVLAELADRIGLRTVDEAYLCGPASMTAELRDALSAMGTPTEGIHIEHFVPPPVPVVEEGGQLNRSMTIVHAGSATRVRVSAGETILDSGLRAGLDLPYSCRSGVCGTCRAVACEGEVSDGAGSGGRANDRVLLACRSRPDSDDVVVSFDALGS